jgi:hypothetical protein
MTKTQNSKGAAGGSVVVSGRHCQRRIRGVFLNFGHWDLGFFWPLGFRDLGF